jgi:hypothetical protein
MPNKKERLFCDAKRVCLKVGALLLLANHYLDEVVNLVEVMPHYSSAAYGKCRIALRSELQSTDF